MADKTARETGASGGGAGPNTLAEAPANPLQALNWFGSAWLETWGTLGTELSQFVAERIAEDVRTQHEMLKCRSAAELNAVQSAFVKKAIDDYTSETGKLVSLQQDLMARLSRPPG